jgi:hypothetical protein
MRRSGWTLALAFALSTVALPALPERTADTAEGQFIPAPCIRIDAFRLDGEWVAGDGWASSSFTFAPRRGGDFAVIFATRTSLGGHIDISETAKLIARRDGYAVVLSRPVDDFGAVYGRLWALKVGPDAAVALVPAASLHDVKRAYDAGGCTDFRAAFECRHCYSLRPAPGSAR